MLALFVSGVIGGVGLVHDHGSVGLVHERRSVWTTLGELRTILWRNYAASVTNHIPLLPYVLFALALAVVAGPVVVFLSLYHSQLGQAISVALRNSAPQLRQVLLVATAFPLRLIQVFIVIFRANNKPINARIYDDQLAANLFDLAVQVGLIVFFWVHGTARLSLFLASLPGWALPSALVWLSVGAIYCLYNLPSRSSLVEFVVDASVAVLLLGGLLMFSVGWVLHLLSSHVHHLERAVQRVLSPVLLLLERVGGMVMRFVLRPIGRIVETVFFPLRILFRWIGRIFPAEWLARAISSVVSAVSLVLVLLFIIVTLYRIPTLIRAFRDRGAGETAAETIWRAVEQERAWLQSSSQQRANRWRAVAQRKRLKKAQASAQAANDPDDGEEEDEEEEEVAAAPSSRRRSSSRSPARKAATRSKSPRAKSPRAKSKSPRRK